MKPKPFVSLNHFTVPVAIVLFLLLRAAERPPCHASLGVERAHV
jgi:hypothetical protein